VLDAPGVFVCVMCFSVHLCVCVLMYMCGCCLQSFYDIKAAFMLCASQDIQAGRWSGLKGY
jgi:hypothetical protein